MADLTTLAAVKADLKIGAEDLSEDAKLSPLITSVSRRFEEAADRVFSLASYTETFDGGGRSRILLTEYPVQSVTSVLVDGVAVAPRSSVTGNGWVLRDKDAAPAVELVGSVFSEGVQNVVIAYQAGFTTIPDDIARAVLETVVAAYRQGPVSHLQISNVGGEYTQFKPGFVWSPFAYSVLQDYRRPGIA